ncbi:hypothetical protein GCM10007962_28870 [Yeosuana aromativorans]|uniref:Uncharacterized protein n=1 Tax=Yeosuana aromativorans TaxID=288019 RepID=A0A8J3BR47_9FLAO|nr:hypothetical protein GCM10007962_28870 [Yeosuana aromativorans]
MGPGSLKGPKVPFVMEILRVLLLSCAFSLFRLCNKSKHLYSFSTLMYKIYTHLHNKNPILTNKCI